MKIILVEGKDFKVGSDSSINSLSSSGWSSSFITRHMLWIFSLVEKERRNSRFVLVIKNL